MLSDKTVFVFFFFLKIQIVHQVKVCDFAGSDRITEKDVSVEV